MKREQGGCLPLVSVELLGRPLRAAVSLVGAMTAPLVFAVILTGVPAMLAAAVVLKVTGNQLMGPREGGTYVVM